MHWQWRQWIILRISSLVCSLHVHVNIFVLTAIIISMCQFWICFWGQQFRLYHIDYYLLFKICEEIVYWVFSHYMLVIIMEDSECLIGFYVVFPKNHKKSKWLNIKTVLGCLSGQHVHMSWVPWFEWRPGPNKDHHKNGTDCLPAWHAGIRVGVWQCYLTL